MTEPAFSVVINGKAVDFDRVIPQAKPFKQFVTGELRVLDRLGFAITGRDFSQERLTYDDLFGLICFYALKANPTLRPSDLDVLTVEEFGKISAAFSEKFMPILFPPKAEEEPKENPLATGSAGSPTSSQEPSDGHEQT